MPLIQVENIIEIINRHHSQDWPDYGYVIDVALAEPQTFLILPLEKDIAKAEPYVIMFVSRRTIVDVAADHFLCR
jgi:hypothetical protein